MTLRRRLLLWYSGVFFFSAAFLVTAMYLLTAHKMRKEFSHYFRDEYEEAQRIVREHSVGSEELERAVETEVRGRSYFPVSYELYDTNTGKPILSMAPKWKDKLPAPPACPDDRNTHLLVRRDRPGRRRQDRGRGSCQKPPPRDAPDIPCSLLGLGTRRDG